MPEILPTLSASYETGFVLKNLQDWEQLIHIPLIRRSAEEG
jgi:hypothetical protein